MEKRHLEGQLRDVKQKLLKTQNDLDEAVAVATEQQEESQATANLLKTAEGRIQNLETELAITKSDVGEVSQQNSYLLTNLKLVQAQQRSEEKIREQRLGRKRVNEIGPGAIWRKPSKRIRFMTLEAFEFAKILRFVGLLSVNHLQTF